MNCDQQNGSKKHPTTIKLWETAPKSMEDITIVFMGFINQLITGENPPLLYVYTCIYMSRDPHTPPSPSQMVRPPLWQGRGGFLSSQADIRKIYSSVQGVCQQCPGTAWAALVSIHRNHGVCSLYSAYSAYSAYVSIIRMDILYVI